MADAAGPSLTSTLEWVGLTAVDTDGEKVGKVADVYVVADTDSPEWLSVTTGLAGTRVSFVPIAGARRNGDDVVLAWPKDRIEGSPDADEQGELTVAEESALFAHYGLPYGEDAAAHPATDLAELDRDPESAERRPLETGRPRLRRHRR
jgi:hypothetical protein